MKKTFDLDKLKSQLAYVAEHSPYYKRILKAHNIAINSIACLEDLQQIPFTSKDDLASNNADFLCVPKDKIADYVTTSGTMGNPVAFYLTANDIARLADNEAHSMQLAGATREDLFQLMVTMDHLFMAGLAYYFGIQKLGAGVVRSGPGSPESQLNAMLQFESTVLIAIPSFIVKLIDYAQAKNIDLTQTKVHSIICIGEPIRNSDFSLNKLGQRIAQHWNVGLYSTYASTEISTAFTECKQGNGGHLNHDLLVLEVINEFGNQAAEGELGEVVITHLGVEGMPLLRYKTGDLCAVYYTPCACGNESPRLGPIVGRNQQMIKFKGTTLYPAALFDVLASQHIDLFQIEVKKNDLGSDEVTLVLESALAVKLPELQSAFRSQIRVTPNFRFEAIADLQKKVFNDKMRKQQKIVFS